MRRWLPLLLIAAGCTSAPRYVHRFDKPDEADAYYAMKRAGAEDPHARYAAARQQMRRMPQYSTVADGAVGPAISAFGGRPFDRWEFLGPGNIGGRTRTLVIDPADAGVMWSGGVSGGIWKTTDGGQRWEPVADEMVNLAVNSIAIDPRDGNVLYAGTGEGYFREEVRGTGLPLRGNGIFVTRDGGETWQQLPSTDGTDFHWVNDLIVSGHDSRRIYAATRSGVLRSDDGGAAWTTVLPVTAKGGCLDLAMRDDAEGDYLFASCGTLDQATVYRNVRAESEGSWTVVLSEPNMGRTTLAIAPSRPSTIYALSATNESGARNQSLLAVFRSDANGDAGTWEARVRGDDSVRLNTLLLTNPLPATGTTCSNAERDTLITMGWYCNVIAVDPLDPERVWAAGVDLFRSDDGGRNWGVASYWWADPSVPSFAHADHHGIVFHPAYDGVSNQTMFATTDGGVYRTDNARAPLALGPAATCDPTLSQVRFRSLNHNYGATQFYHGAVSPDGTRYMGGAQDNGTILGSPAAGPEGWRMISGGDGGYVAFDPRNPSVMYVESQGANIRRSIDGGDRFQPARGGLNDEFLFITPFTIDANEPNRLWTGGWFVWRTENNALTWTIRSQRLAGRVTGIAVAPGRSNRVVVGTSSGEVYRNDAALTSTQWSPSKPRDGWVSWIQFDPADSAVVYATYAGFGGPHVWKSSDAGATWTSIDGNLPDIPVHSIAIDPARRDRLYLGTDLGVFVTLNGGAEWQVENSGFAPAVTETVLIAQGARGPAVYAFTHGRGVWRAELAPRDRRRAVAR
jgi:photosystem II stability/assembly factor-like uncharacterized protein